MNGKKQVEKALRERIKELNCLYGMAQLSERNRDLGRFLERLVDFLPRSWQYPGDTCVRITFQGKVFRSRKYRKTKWYQAAPIFVRREEMGEVAVYYMKERPAADEGPFLLEERKLLEEVVKRIGEIATRSLMEQDLIKTNRQLMQERRALEEANSALRSVLSAIEFEKKQIHMTMRENIARLVMPTLHALMPAVSKEHQKILGIVKTNLEELALPAMPVLSGFQSLTPVELSVCNLIKNGLRTKEIARFRGVSELTIHRQRESIRRKLKISNLSVNLATYLQTHSPPGAEPLKERAPAKRTGLKTDF